jgi:hypothetical protein
MGFLLGVHTCTPCANQINTPITYSFSIALLPYYSKTSSALSYAILKKYKSNYISNLSTPEISSTTRMPESIKP